MGLLLPAGAENTSDCFTASGEASGQLAGPSPPRPENGILTIGRGFGYSDQLQRGSKSARAAKIRSPEPAEVTWALLGCPQGQAGACVLNTGLLPAPPCIFSAPLR